MILKHILASTRYLVLLAVAGTLLGSISLLVYELLVVGKTFVDAVRDGVLSPKSAKTLAVGLIEAVDVFLIAIAVYITGLGLFSLFVDDSLP
ncbi:YqhA family protein, partial [Methylomagnum sp.]